MIGQTMQRRQFLSRVAIWGLAGTATCGVSGCGTLIHAERRGQPHSDRLDWGIVTLDGLGLLLFFIPGVIAFVVDFGTGAIYLPPEAALPAAPPPSPGSGPPTPSQQASLRRPAEMTVVAQDPSVWQRLGLRRVVIPREQLERERLEQIATQCAGQRVSLDDSATRVSVLPCLEHFEEQAQRHRSDRSFGVAVRSFFERFQRRAA